MVVPVEVNPDVDPVVVAPDDVPDVDPVDVPVEVEPEVLPVVEPDELPVVVPVRTSCAPSHGHLSNPFRMHRCPSPLHE